MLHFGAPFGVVALSLPALKPPCCARRNINVNTTIITFTPPSSHDRILQGDFDVEQYGALSLDPKRYPLFAVKTRSWVDGRPLVLVTGGVHGYETSGVQGALKVTVR